MAKRLVKIARDLNVGTATIVEHLLKSGFEIENKPTARITEEMETELLREFQKSLAIKEQADQLVIGNRPGVKKEDDHPHGEEPAKKPIFSPAPPVEKKAVEVKPDPVESASEEKPAPQKKAEPAVVNKEKEEPAEEEKPRVQLKIKGKIDLEKSKAAPKKEKVEEKPKEEVKEEVVAEKKKEIKKKEEPVESVAKEEPAKDKKKKAEKEEEKIPVVKKVEEKESVEEKAVKGAKKKDDDMIRAKTPQLKGLKILGKIDTDRLKKPKKKKTDKSKKEDDKKATPGGVARKGASTDDRPKRKRKRKKVPKSSITDGRTRGSQSGGRSRRGKDEVKEVSQKEIDEKIKATMARLSGGGRKKRQKLRRDNRERHREKQEQIAQEQESGELQLTEFVTVSELASLMDVPVTDVITTCMNLGVIVSINQRLDAEIIELVADEFGHEVEFITAEEEAIEEEVEEDDPADLQPRSPIVTVMGHVDHGKTSLLDYIRSAKVAEGEAGGITQHIGAYEVRVGEENKKITFLDTPGHEAFTAMRARGAKVTDVAVVIVAADDNVMPQTKEAISHAQAAGVPIIFAINKIDKPGAQPERIKQELANMNLLLEEWGGEYQSQDISAKTGENIDQLLEKILLEAEMLELQANPDRRSNGVVLEASLDKGRGYVAKLLVQNGTLNIGDPIVAGEHSGKVKAMFNEFGKRVKKVGPSRPVLVLGLSGAPQAGEKFKETENEPEARQIASRRAQISREQANRASKRISLDEIGRRLALGTFKELNLIVKGDVDGSVEALSDSLIKLSVETIQVNVIHKAVGQIIESDVLLASASDAIVIGFQVRPSLGARKLAEREGVQIKTYSIIYEAIEEIKAAMEGMLEPTREEKISAQLEVREVYKISKVGTVAGCYVQEGKIMRNSHIRLIRDGIVVFPTKEGAHGEISSLKRFKDDVKEVKSGLECGVTIKNFNDIKVGDVIEAYEVIEIKQKLEI
jgi:translation initiation factor IF-2